MPEIPDELVLVERCPGYDPVWVEGYGLVASGDHIRLPRAQVAERPDFRLVAPVKPVKPPKEVPQVQAQAQPQPVVVSDPPLAGTPAGAENPEGEQ